MALCTDICVCSINLCRTTVMKWIIKHEVHSLKSGAANPVVAYWRLTLLPTPSSLITVHLLSLLIESVKFMY